MKSARAINSLLRCFKQFSSTLFIFVYRFWQTTETYRINRQTEMHAFNKRIKKDNIHLNTALNANSLVISVN